MMLMPEIYKLIRKSSISKKIILKIERTGNEPDLIACINLWLRFRPYSITTWASMRSLLQRYTQLTFCSAVPSFSELDHGYMRFNSLKQ